jgi:hypothetical protein
VASAVLFFSACGGSSKVSPRAYVRSVCTAVGGWLSQIKGLQSQLTVKPPTTPVQGRQALQSFIAKVIIATDQTRSQVKSAGVPDISNGQQVSSALVSAFDQVKGALAQARSQANQLSISSPTAFNSSATQLGSTVQQTLSGIGSGLSGLRAPSLEKASSQTPACQSLNSA